MKISSQKQGIIQRACIAGFTLFVLLKSIRQISILALVQFNLHFIILDKLVNVILCRLLPPANISIATGSNSESRRSFL
jgi:hypothetical protein